MESDRFQHGAAGRSPWPPALALLAAVTALALAGPSWRPLAGADGTPLGGVLQRTYTTAWATMIMLLPAAASFWLRRTSGRGAATWRVYWTAGYVAYVVHLVWAVALFFGLDLARMLRSPEFVTAPRLGMVVTLGWTVDVVLAWTRRSEPRWLAAGRSVIHALVVGMFVAGSLLEGSFVVSRVLGLALAAAALLAPLRWWWWRGRAGEPVGDFRGR